MHDVSNAGFSTRSIHAGYDPNKHLGAVNPPVFMTSTYAQEEPGKHQGFEYSRTGNPTRHALELLLANLEGAGRALAFGSGSAASDAILKTTLKSGDRVLYADDVYGGTFRLFDKAYSNFGIHFDRVDTTDLDAVKAAIKPGTRIIWMESPSNPLLKVSDIAGLAKIAHEAGALLVVDNTFATPYLQQPIAHGADIIVHSATKYLGGHSDVVLGCVMARAGVKIELPKLGEMDLGDALAFHQNSTGGTPGPMDSYLVHRGIKTLALRMERHCDNAEKIAAFLEGHKRVTKVIYPGLASHAGHAVAQRQMSRYGGMISFEIDGSIADGVSVVSGRRFWTLAESLGGVESLIEHPCSMTHGAIPKPLRQAAGLEDGLIRLSTGIEDAGDLIADLEEGLNAY